MTVEFVATRAGRYQFRCTNYCGLGHDGMLGSFNVRGTTTGVQIVATGPAELDGLGRRAAALGAVVLGGEHVVVAVDAAAGDEVGLVAGPGEEAFGARDLSQRNLPGGRN